MGRNDGIEAVLQNVVRPRAAYLAAKAESLPAVNALYNIDPGPPMIRMWVDRARFQPAPAAVERLLPVEVGELNRLYQLGFAAWLPSSTIAEGIYYGIRVNGKLVSAAGTHVISRNARLAVVGNVLTHTDHRGRGYAQAVTSAVTAELLRFCDQVVLNVRSDNPPAIQAYVHLGYTEHCRFEERLIRRTTSPWADLTAPLRRLFSRRLAQPSRGLAGPRRRPARATARQLRPGPSDRFDRPAVRRRPARGTPMTDTTTHVPHDVTDLSLAAEGLRRIEWAEREMPVLRLIRERFEREKPLAGLRIGACLHVTTETANLMRTLKAGGADVYLAASNPLSTQDVTAAALVAELGIATFARRGEDRDTYYAHLRSVADIHPTLTMDDGCDLVSLLHSERRDQLPEVLAGTEETTTGVIRLRAMAADNALAFPVVAVNEAQTKHLFDNRYGTGQSTIDGILRATNILIAGRNVAIAGYGWVGRGIASRMSGHGAHVAVIEVDPVRALEALMDGYQVMTAAEAAPWGDLFVTATGNINVFRREHFASMKDGAIMANSGHFDAELDLPALREMAEGHVTEPRDNVQQFDIGGKKLNLVAEGRLVNLGAAEGHPAAVMDMSFANQALSAEYVAKHHAELEAKVYVVPEAIDAEVARLKLAAMGHTLDPMTPEQLAYVSSWQHGT